MATYRPLVYNDGFIDELPSSDNVEGASASDRVIPGSGLIGSSEGSGNNRIDVALAPNPSGLQFNNDGLAIDGQYAFLVDSAYENSNTALSGALQAQSISDAAVVTAQTALASGNAALVAVENLGPGSPPEIACVVASGTVDAGQPVGAAYSTDQVGIVGNAAYVRPVSYEPVAVPIYKDLAVDNSDADFRGSDGNSVTLPGTDVVITCGVNLNWATQLRYPYIMATETRDGTVYQSTYFVVVSSYTSYVKCAAYGGNNFGLITVDSANGIRYWWFSYFGMFSKSDQYVPSNCFGSQITQVTAVPINTSNRTNITDADITYSFTDEWPLICLTSTYPSGISTFYRVEVWSSTNKGQTWFSVFNYEAGVAALSEPSIRILWPSYVVIAVTNYSTYNIQVLVGQYSSSPSSINWGSSFTRITDANNPQPSNDQRYRCRVLDIPWGSDKVVVTYFGSEYPVNSGNYYGGILCKKLQLSGNSIVGTSQEFSVAGGLSNVFDATVCYKTCGGRYNKMLSTTPQSTPAPVIFAANASLIGYTFEGASMTTSGTINFKLPNALVPIANQIPGMPQIGGSARDTHVAYRPINQDVMVCYPDDSNSNMVQGNVVSMTLNAVPQSSVSPTVDGFSNCIGIALTSGNGGESIRVAVPGGVYVSDTEDYNIGDYVFCDLQGGLVGTPYNPTEFLKQQQNQGYNNEVSIEPSGYINDAPYTYIGRAVSTSGVAVVNTF